jgi:hypothetical protein
MWGALSDERTGQPFTIDAAPRQRSRWVQVPQNLWPYFTVSDSRLPKPGGPGPQLYPQALGFLFVASYDLQGYSGGIHWLTAIVGSSYMPLAQTTQKTSFLIIIVKLLPWEHVCLQNRYSVMAIIYLLMPQTLPIDGFICHNMFDSHFWE